MPVRHPRRHPAQGFVAATLLAAALPAAFLLGAALIVMTAASPSVADVLTVRDVEEIAAVLEAEGRYTEFDLDAALALAVDDANADGVAFVWLDSTEVGLGDAERLLVQLSRRSDRYDTVLALGTDGVWADSLRGDAGAAALEALPEFAAGRNADGVLGFLHRLDSGTAGNTSASSGSSSPSAVTEGSGSGGGLWWLGIVALVVAGVFTIRWALGRRRARAAEHRLIEIDRAEIAEQLKDNADRVIELGDKVIAAKDAELISLYEEASAAYQDVSTQVGSATTVEAINHLDQRIDRAEWQFEVIEARLAGRLAPAEPAPPPAPTTGPDTSAGAGMPNDEPALGPDESVFGTGRRSGTTGGRPAPRRARRSPGNGGLGDILGGGMTGGLGGGLGSIILGRGRPRNTSDRSRQRRSATGSWETRPPGGRGGGATFGRSGASSRSTRRSDRSDRKRDGRGGGGSF